MARSLGRQSVTVVARTVDSDGDWKDADRLLVTGCVIQPQTPSEVQSPGRAVSTSRYIVYGPIALAKASSSDQLETSARLIGGEPGDVVRLSIEGQPAVWTRTDGRVDHVELIAELVSG